MSKTLIFGRGRAAVCLSVLLLTSAGLVACGGSSGSGSHTSSGAPSATGAGTTSASGSASNAASGATASTSKAANGTPGSSQSALGKAAAARQALLRRKRPVAPTTPAASRFRQALIRFASCLRQNGVDIPVPSSKGNGPLLNTRGVKTNTPQFRAASTKCRTVLFSALRPAKR